MNRIKHRVVLDTNEIVGAGAGWIASGIPQPRTPVQWLVFSVGWHHTGLYSEVIFEEYTRVLRQRPHNRENLIEYIGCIREFFERVVVTRTQCPHEPTDECDTMFILCALDGNADFLITEDKHLRALKSAYNPPQIGNMMELGSHFEITNRSSQAVPSAAPIP